MTLNTSLIKSYPAAERLSTATSEEKCRRSLIEFARQAWHLIEPATPFVESWHISAICEHLQAVSEGQIKRLIINVPPRTGKSSLVSTLWPCWEWARDPSIRFMFASYAEQLSFLFSVRRRDHIITSEWYQKRWGDKYALSGSMNLKHLFANDKSGYMFATSTGGQVTGYGGTRMVLDDPHDPQGAASDVQRDTTSEWLMHTWPTRMDPGTKGAEVLIMQRLHEMDATGLYLSQGLPCVHLKIPMEYAGHKNTTSSGFSDPRTEDKELLSGKFFTREQVDELRKRLGPYAYAGQYDQEPAPTEGGLIKRAWIRHYEEKDGRLDVGDYKVDPTNCVRFCTVDPAMTEKDLKNQNDPDYTVMAAWALFQATRGTLLILLDLIRDRMEGPQIVEKLKSFHAHWQFAVIGVENVSEKMLFQTMKREGLPIRDISKRLDAIYTISGGKKARALAATPLMADGRFYVPTYAPWLGDFIRELTLFPNAAHDDCVDCLSYGCLLAGKVSGYMAETPDQEPKTVLSHDERPADRDDKPDSLSGWRSTRDLGFRYGR